MGVERLLVVLEAGVPTPPARQRRLAFLLSADPSWRSGLAPPRDSEAAAKCPKVLPCYLEAGVLAKRSDSLVIRHGADGRMPVAASDATTCAAALLKLRAFGWVSPKRRAAQPGSQARDGGEGRMVD